MSRLTIILAVFTIALTSNQVIAKSFIKRALENLQKHQNDQLVQLQDKYQQRDDSDDEDNLNSFNLQGFGNLLGLALHSDYDDGNRKQANRKKSHRNSFIKKQLGQFNKLSLDNLMSYNPNRAVYTERKKQPLLDLLGASNYAKTGSDFNDNAQVYLILDEDILKSESRNSLDDLVSTLLKSSSSSQKDRSDERAEHRYKGFRVRDSYRKARGDSSEKYASEDDEDARPAKRPRAYVGKGRTAIPYIRNRGDIYEKDY